MFFAQKSTDAFELPEFKRRVNLWGLIYLDVITKNYVKTFYAKIMFKNHCYTQQKLLKYIFLYWRKKLII